MTRIAKVLFPKKENRYKSFLRRVQDIHLRRKFAEVEEKKKDMSKKETSYRIFFFLFHEPSAAPRHLLSTNLRLSQGERWLYLDIIRTLPHSVEEDKRGHRD